MVRCSYMTATVFIAPAVGFNWVQGSYYDKLSEAHLRYM